VSVDLMLQAFVFYGIVPCVTLLSEALVLGEVCNFTTSIFKFKTLLHPAKLNIYCLIKACTAAFS